MEEKESTVTITIEEYNNLIEGELERSLIVNYISHHVGYDDVYNEYTLENASALYEILVALGYGSLLKEMRHAKEGAENGL